MHQDRAKFAAEALFFLNTTWLSCYHMQTTVKRDKQTVNYGTLGLQEILTKKKLKTSNATNQHPFYPVMYCFIYGVTKIFSIVANSQIF